VNSMRCWRSGILDWIAGQISMNNLLPDLQLILPPNEKGERCGGENPKLSAAKSLNDTLELLAEARCSAAFAPPTGSAIHGSSVKNLTLWLSAIARWRARQTTASWPNPLCAFAPLRLCVAMDAAKTQSRKDAKPQAIKPTRPRRRTREVSDRCRRRAHAVRINAHI